MPIYTEIYRGYYTVAQTYEVYLQVEKIFHEWAQRKKICDSFPGTYLI